MFDIDRRMQIFTQSVEEGFTHMFDIKLKLIDTDSKVTRGKEPSRGAWVKGPIYSDRR